MKNFFRSSKFAIFLSSFTKGGPFLNEESLILFSMHATSSVINFLFRLAAKDDLPDPDDPRKEQPYHRALLQMHEAHYASFGINNNQKQNLLLI